MEDSFDTKRYDRQIRLWGLDTQRGLAAARVLLLSATGLADELAKNLVLAGVHTLTLLDTRTLTTLDTQVGGSFTATKESVGRNRADAAAEALQELNPSVSVRPLAGPLASVDDETLRGFHFIIGTRGVHSVSEMLECTRRLRSGGGTAARKRPRVDDDAASAPEPKLLLAGAHGLFGFCVLDLGQYEYHVDIKDAKTNEVTGTSSRQISYPQMDDALAVPWSRLGPRVPRLWCVLQLLCEQMRGGDINVDAAALETLRTSKLAELARPEAGFLREPVSAEYVALVAEHSASELSPVCAIVGGMVAAEVIKIISGKELPIDNVLTFDATTKTEAAAQVSRLG